jgi:hypothetical protein
VFQQLQRVLPVTRIFDAGSVGGNGLRKRDMVFKGFVNLVSMQAGMRPIFSQGRSSRTTQKAGAKTKQQQLQLYSAKYQAERCPSHQFYNQPIRCNNEVK